MAQFERAGLPTVGLVSRSFEDDWEYSAKVFGMPDLPYVVVPYTMTSRNAEEAGVDVGGVFENLLLSMTKQPAVRPHTPDAEVWAAETEVFSGTDQLEAWSNFNREFLDRDLGDGFPLVAPTPELVEAFIATTKRDRMEVVGNLSPAYGAATVEKIAINAAMAGCSPEHLVVLIAAVEAITETPESTFPARAISMSTSPNALMMLVNGPVVGKLGINFGRGTLGPGKLSRVNTALGRALRLILMNIGHCYVGSGDMDTIGSPLKYSMCLAENEDANPWSAFHRERGFSAEQSTVTVFGTNDVIHMGNYQRDSEQLLMAWAARASVAGHANPLIPSRFEFDENHCVMLISPDHARNLAQDGHTKNSIREFISKNAKVPLKFMLSSLPTSLDSLPSNLQWILQLDPETLISVVPNPETIQVVVVGGPTGKSDWVRLSGEPTITKVIENGAS
jgi:hypothetical protein